MFSHRTQIQFSESLYHLLVPLVLLLTWGCCYWLLLIFFSLGDATFFHVAITFFPFITIYFSFYCYYFSLFIAIVHDT
jgi:hypothetical protein